MNKSNNLIRQTIDGLVPNIIRGGNAIDLGNDLFFIQGRSHNNGGVDVGNNLEVEGGEIIQVDKDNVKVFSARPFLGGYSPSQLVLAGNNPETVFALQEKYKPKDNNGNKAGFGDFIKNVINKIKGNKNNNEETKTNNEETKTDDDKSPKPINFGEIAVKQAYKESSFNANAKSNKNAVGLFQIRPITVKEFNRLTGKNYTIEDMNDIEKNYEVRNTIMNWLSERPFINKPGISDSLRVGRTLAAYNMGAENFRQTLNQAAAEGNDISDWKFLDYVGGEPRDYVNFILRNQDINQYYNDEEYQKAIVKFKDLVDFVRQNNGYDISTKQTEEKTSMKNGGLSPLSKNQLIVYTPFSTGEKKGANTINIKHSDRDKAELGLLEWNAIGQGATSLLGNLVSGIGSSIVGNRLKKLYNNLTRTSTYVPVAREHINTTVDVNPQLDAVRNAQTQANRMIDVNTNSSKAAINRKRSVALNSLAQGNTIYGDKLNRETQLRNAEAQLQTQYNMIDNANKIKDIEAQNDFEMQRRIGLANAGNTITNGWMSAAQNVLGDSANIFNNMLSGYLSLAGSQNKELADIGISGLQRFGLGRNTLNTSTDKNQKGVDVDVIRQEIEKLINSGIYNLTKF